MELVDVNVLLHAFREDSPEHEAHHAWLQSLVSSDSAFAVSELVLSAFLRIVTHPRIWDPPTPLEAALEFAEALRSQPNAVVVASGPRHWPIFTRLCRDSDARGNLVPDAYLAALAIEAGAELVSSDRDFSRFRGLQWRLPR